jgi:hypothetical protein
LEGWIVWGEKKEMKHAGAYCFDHYCNTFRCRMSRKACIARQSLAIKPIRHRLNFRLGLVSRGFYPECYNCSRGRQAARRSGIDIPKMRKQLSSLRSQIEESDLAATFSYFQYRR